MGIFSDAQGQLTLKPLYVYVVFLRRSRSDNFKVPCPICPKFELLIDIMHVLDTYKFKMEGINSSRKKWQHRFFRRSKAANTVVRGWIRPNFEFIYALLYVIITCKYEEDPIKTNREKVATPCFSL